MGLLHLREFQPFRIYATPAVFQVLTEENTLFRTLERSMPPVQWEPLQLDKATEILGPTTLATAEINCRAVSLSGEFPDYARAELRNRLPKEEAVVGLELSQGNKRLFYAPCLPAEAKTWTGRMAQTQATLLDGTFWSDNELIEVTGTGKRARDMGHLPLSGAGGLLEQLRREPMGKRLLIHINNTNPILDEESPASDIVRQAGWEVAYDGLEFEL